ncbi:MAG: VWA domain-containing protein [Saprospiraceae bacterium]|nr:VWA domain-containing protein [Saprospiraceae bacterium]MDW8484482.1 VWA domain-containing protein [Saprospiraceae bacterium]
MFSFEHTEYLLLLWILPIWIVLWLIYLRWRSRALGRLAAQEVQKRLLPGWSVGRFWLKNASLLIATALLIVAAANPRRGVQGQVSKQQSADVILALDISQSMLARDVLPNRLERAKIFARRLIQTLTGERIGVVFFAGNAYPAIPLTTDYEAADILLRSATPEFISAQGSNLGEALLTALERFDPSPNTGRAIVLVSDGEDHEGLVPKALNRLRDAGVVVFCVGVGTAEGAPIPLPEGEYKRDANNQLVQTRANDALLRRIASATRGEFYRVEQAPRAIDAIRREIGRLEHRVVAARSFEKFESYYAWFALPAFLLLTLYAALSWRVRTTLIFSLMFAVNFSDGLAQSAHQWLQEGNTQYAKGRYAEAEKAYREALRQIPDDPKALYNIGNAFYKQNQYAQAQQAWERALSAAATPAQKADAWHNLGNALAQQGKIREAIRAYENSLRFRPGDIDTKTNLQLARQKLRQNSSQHQQREHSSPARSNVSPKSDSMPAPPSPSRQSPQSSTHAEGRLTPEQARQLLETTVAPQDQNSGRKYRQKTPKKHALSSKKDW